MAGVLGADGADHPKLGRDDVQLLAGLLPDAHKLGAAQAALLLFGDVDHDLITGESFWKGPPLGLHACVLGDANHLLGILSLTSLRLGGLRFIEEPQLSLVLFAEGFAAAGKKPLLESCDLLMENVYALCQFSSLVGQVGVLLLQLSILAQQCLDIPLHGAHSSTTQ